MTARTSWSKGQAGTAAGGLDFTSLLDISILDRPFQRIGGRPDPFYRTLTTGIGLVPITYNEIRAEAWLELKRSHEDR